MELKLRVTQGKNVGQEIVVPGKKFLIGRAEDCNLRPGSDLISRHHCVIIVDGPYLAVRDFGSKNGTYVNGERVIGECELKHADQLRVGPLEFELVLNQGALGGKKLPPVHDAKEAAARAASRPAPEPADDVARWLSDPAVAPPVSKTQETQIARIGDTDEIDVGSTRELDLGMLPASAIPAAAVPPAATPAKPAASAPVPQPKSALQPAASTPSVSAPAPSAPTKPAIAPKPAYEQPAPEAAVSQDDSTIIAPVKKLVPGGKKTFGKLPQAGPAGTKDSREAANNMLNKFRKRR